MANDDRRRSVLTTANGSLHFVATGQERESFLRSLMQSRFDPVGVVAHRAAKRRSEAVWAPRPAEFSKYLSLPAGGLEALALWCLFAWAHEAFSISPILTLVSPTMRAGKSTVFEMLEQLLIPDTYHPSSITKAALYRLKGIAEPDQATPPLEVKRPTLCLLMDEADNWLSLDKDLRAVLNSGWTRRSAFVTALPAL